MSSLFGSMSIATGAMLVEQAAISVTANNVSNIDTPGYTRQVAELSEAEPHFDGTCMVGTGVSLEQITSLRDRILELRVQDENQQQGSLQAQVSSLSDINLEFSTQNANIGDALNKFFDSLSSLSPDPSNISLRQSVLMSAQNLASQFQSTSNLLHQRQFSVELEIQQAVDQVNGITSQIADLNQKITTSGTPEDQQGTFVDQRNLLLQNLSSLIGNHVIQGDDGLTVAAPDGTPLVVGSKAYAIDTSKDPNGNTLLEVGGHDITDSQSGGSIQGLLQVRQQTIPSILAGLDAIAYNLATNVNSLHAQGTDLDGNPGADFFVAPTSESGAAAAMAVRITDPRQIAASTDGSTGGNSNLNALTDLRNEPIVNGSSVVDAYSNLTFQVGSQLAEAQSGLQNAEAMSQQLSDQRGAISGVSLDEEASNLIRYQRAYEAAARVLSVISDLTEVSVNLGKS